MLGVVERVEAAGQARLAMLADLYHLARMGEDPVEVVARHWRRFGHVQIADAPGRHQPGTGELDFDRIFDALAATGYEGHVGLEYKPLGASADSFAWLDPAARSSAPRPPGRDRQEV